MHLPGGSGGKSTVDRCVSGAVAVRSVHSLGGKESQEGEAALRVVATTAVCMRAHDDHPLRPLLPHPPAAFQEEANLTLQRHRVVADRDRLVVRDVEQHVVNRQMRPRPGMPPIGTAQGVYHRGEELLVAGTVDSVIAAATTDVDVLPTIPSWHHTLEQGLQQDRRALGLELGVNLAQVPPLFLDVLAVNRVPVDDRGAHHPFIRCNIR
jgi:hypothetical protein